MNLIISTIYPPFSKFFNKFHCFQETPQHLCNRQDVRTLKYIYAYLIPMRLIMTYRTGKNLTQKIITYAQDCVMKTLKQLISHWIYSLIWLGQLFLQMISHFTSQVMTWDINFHQVCGLRTWNNLVSIWHFNRCHRILISTKLVVRGPEIT